MVPGTILGVLGVSAHVIFKHIYNIATNIFVVRMRESYTEIKFLG